jgi:RNA polymerase sigma factor (sigma-70 family)
MLTDEQLTQRMTMGDHAAFQTFMKRHRSPLLGFLEHKLREREKAEDFVQETFMRLYKQFQSERVPVPVKPWLYRVSLNLCRDYWKSRCYRAVVRMSEATLQLTDTMSSPAEVCEHRETRREMAHTLMRLGETQRKIVFLRFYRDLKLQDISLLLGLPLSTVKTHLYKGLRSLRQGISRNTQSL